MFKPSVLSQQLSFKKYFKSNWISLWVAAAILLPVAFFYLFIVFESEIAGLIMSLYPPSPRQGKAYFYDFVYLARTEILWLGFFSLLTLFLAFYPSREAIHNFLIIRSRTKVIYYVMLICSTFFLSTIVIEQRVLENFPNSSDEYAYLFQAEMFSRGKLWERAHDLPDFFYSNNITQHDRILVSRFPPGWPLVLSIAFEVGMQPSLINPLLGLVTLIVFYLFARRIYNTTVAVWSLLAVALTGFYIYNSASYFSHVSCLLVTLLFVFNIYLYLEKKFLLYGLLAGFFLAFVAIIRYYTAVLIFIPFFVYLITQYRFRIIPLFIVMGIGSIPCMAYLFWYNYSITGDAFTPVTVWAYPDERLGFVRGHTVLKGIEHVIRRILMFIYWCSPGLLILYFIFLWRKIRSPVERFIQPEDYIFITLVIGYFFYYQIGGNQYGPRFYFEGFPFLVLFIVSKVLKNREKWTTALLLASVLYPVVRIPFISQREAVIIDERQDMYDLVKEQRIHSAVVFVVDPTSQKRPMPADDLTRNDPMFTNDVLYVLELPGINDQLMRYYRDRSFYKYIRDSKDAEGRLIRIR